MQNVLGTVLTRGSFFGKSASSSGKSVIVIRPETQTSPDDKVAFLLFFRRK